MEITGNQLIAAPRQRVWDALNDPEILKASLPGCQSVDRSAPDEFKVVMAAAIGPLRARFNGTLKMTEVQAPAFCTLVFEGQGGAVGFGKGHSSVRLTEVDGQTELSYTAEAQVGGKLAQVGSRLIDSVARKMSDDFFNAFKTSLTGEGHPVAVEGTPPVQLSQTGSKNHDQIPHLTATTDVPNSCRRPNDHAMGGRDATSPLVPAWWLLVASIMGSFLTVTGFWLAR